MDKQTLADVNSAFKLMQKTELKTDNTAETNKDKSVEATSVLHKQNSIGYLLWLYLFFWLLDFFFSNLFANSRFFHTKNISTPLSQLFQATFNIQT